MTTREEPHTPHVPAVEELLERLGVLAAPGDPVTLPHNRRLTPGVWRISTREGPALLKYLCSDRDPGGTPWDRHWTADDQVAHRWNYWAREPLAYRHGITDLYAEAGIHPPACRGVLVDEREAVLLLEWVEGEPGETWPVAGYQTTAEALGRAQAPFLIGQARPDHPWLSRRFLREYSSEKPVDWDLLDDDDAWRHPTVRAAFPPQLRDAARSVHRSRERLYGISEALPRTLCHLDLWPKNLLRRPDGESVLIDWAFTGTGSIGEDIGNLVPDAVFDHFIAARDLPQLEQVVFDAYLRGLRSAGWDDDPRLVRLGMWSAAVKYDWLAPLTLTQTRQERQYRYGGEGEIDATFKFRERSRALLYTATWARRALELADQLGI